MTTGIEWTDETLNPISGCSKVSEGCRNCYAETLDKRFNPRHKPWTAPNAEHNVTLHPERLDKPFHWKKPRKVFVNSMSDLFHEQVPFEFIERVFAVMSVTPQHTYQILTKRPERMLSWFTSSRAMFVSGAAQEMGFGDKLPTNKTLGEWWPLPNVWLGVSVENQQAADERIPLLLQAPAAVRFLSCEPLLGPLDLTARGLGLECESCVTRTAHWCVDPVIDWVIAGGESGPNARPLHPEWVRSLRDQCIETGVPFFFKQWGEWYPRDQWEDNPELVLPDDDMAYVNTSHTHVFEGEEGLYPVHRVGKKHAGRMLDGRTWDEYPQEAQLNSG